MVSVTADLLPAGLIPAGTHVCWVFGHPDDYVSAAVPLLAEAKRLEQQPVLIAPPGSAGLAALEPFAAGAMRLGGTPPDPMVIAGLIREQAALAQAGGYRGVRLVADMNVLHPAGQLPSPLVRQPWTTPPPNWTQPSSAPTSNPHPRHTRSRPPWPFILCCADTTLTPHSGSPAPAPGNGSFPAKSASPPARCSRQP